MTSDGDPKLYPTGDGLDIDVTGGQPDMDEGLENAIALSLFGGAEWWGNAVSADDEKITGRLEEIMARSLTTRTMQDAEEAVNTALAWMTSSGVAKKITASASIPAVGWLALAITIEQPDRTSTIRFNINWQTMAVSVGAL